MKLFEIFFVPPQAGYRPGWPQWLRWLGWAIRNPLPGLTRGWKDRDYAVYCYAYNPASHQWIATFWRNVEHSKCPTWNTVGGRVLKATLAAIDGSMQGRQMVHFWSYRGRFIELAWGYKPSTGTRTLVIRKAHARNEQGKPG